MELDVYNEQGKKVGSVSIDEKVLGEKVRRKLLHQAIVNYQANRRLGTHQTKTKGDRQGARKKPWAQKHTGRARAGDRRSPLWRKGGITFGPHPRDYRKNMPVRMRREALKSALLSKLLDKQVKVLDTLDYESPKTKRFAATMKALGLKGTSCLVALAEAKEPTVKSIRNIDRCYVVPARNLNAYDVLRHKNLVITQSTAENIKEVVHA